MSNVVVIPGYNAYSTVFMCGLYMPYIRTFYEVTGGTTEDIQML